VEIGAEDYGTSAYLGDRDSVIIPVFQRPGSNALAAAEAVKAEMEALAKDFPRGLEYRIVYNPTEFIQKSVDAVITTLIEAVFLVVLVIIVFLQKWRAALIPVLAIPVSLIGTFAVLALLGYSLNNLSLFGLVLAIGIVVDDAIVVVENVERNLEKGLSPLEAARTSMEEVGAALIAIVLVLCAVFVPTLFIGGMSGAFYQQFAITISAATVISLVLSLTLSPAFAALLLRPHQRAPEGARWRRLVEPRFRAIRGCLWPLDGSAGADAAADDGCLCRAHRADRRCAVDDAHRLHPGTGPGLLPDRHPASAGFLHRAHRRRDEEGGGAGAGDPGHRQYGDALRLRWAFGNPRGQLRRRLLGARRFRGTCGPRPDDRYADG
jgi:preprotein translocase subunit SecF